MRMQCKGAGEVRMDKELGMEGYQVEFRITNDSFKQNILMQGRLRGRYQLSEFFKRTVFDWGGGSGDVGRKITSRCFFSGASWL